MGRWRLPSTSSKALAWSTSHATTDSWTASTDSLGESTVRTSACHWSRRCIVSEVRAGAQGLGVGRYEGLMLSLHSHLQGGQHTLHDMLVTKPGRQNKSSWALAWAQRTDYKRTPLGKTSVGHDQVFWVCYKRKNMHVAWTSTRCLDSGFNTSIRG